MKLALVEAGEGRVGTSFDRIVLSCFKYDTATRRYGFYIFGFIRTGRAAGVRRARDDADLLLEARAEERRSGMNELLNNILFLPEHASTFAERVDNLHYFVVGVTMLTSIAVGTAAIFFFFRYRRRRPNQRPSTWCPP